MKVELFRVPTVLVQSALYGLSVALMKGISLIMLPFFTHHLSPDEFGRLEIVSSVALIGSVIIGMGLEQTLYRFAGRANNKKKVASDLYGNSLIFGAVSLFVCTMISTHISRSLPGDISSYEIMLVLAALSLEGCISIPLGWIRMQNKAHLFFLFSTGRAISQAILTLLVIKSGGGISEILEVGLVVTVTQAVLLGYTHKRSAGIRFSLSTTKKAVVYGLPLVGSGLTAFVLSGLDRWILAAHVSLDEVAIFGVSAKFSLAVVLLIQPFSMWWLPNRFQVINKHGGTEKAAKFIAFGTTIVLTVSVLMCYITPIIVELILPYSYKDVATFAIGLIISVTLKELVELYNLGCYTGNTTHSQLAINFAASLIGLICMIILTPIFGIWGVIYGQIVAQLFRLIIFFLVSQYYLPIAFPLLKIFTLSIIASTWISIGSQIQGNVDLILTGFIAICSLIFTAYLLKLYPDSNISAGGTV